MFQQWAVIVASNNKGSSLGCLGPRHFSSEAKIIIQTIIISSSESGMNGVRWVVINNFITKQELDPDKFLKDLNNNNLKQYNTAVCVNHE